MVFNVRLNLPDVPVSEETHPDKHPTAVYKDYTCLITRLITTVQATLDSI